MCFMVSYFIVNAKRNWIGGWTMPNWLKLLLPNSSYTHPFFYILYQLVVYVLNTPINNTLAAVLPVLFVPSCLLGTGNVVKLSVALQLRWEAVFSSCFLFNSFLKQNKLIFIKFFWLSVHSFIVRTLIDNFSFLLSISNDTRLFEWYVVLHLSYHKEYVLLIEFILRQLQKVSITLNLSHSSI